MSLLKLVNGQAVEMTAEEEAEFEASRAPSQTPSVPPEVTRRQAMAILIKTGLDVQIAGALQAQLQAAQASGNAQAVIAARLAINDYETSQNFQRSWPLIAAMQAQFGWSDAYIDQLFIQAAQE